MFLPIIFYQQVIQAVPISCVDIILRTEFGYILVERLEEPLMGSMWVVGGRVHIGETLIDAAIRKLSEEVSLHIKADQLHFVGVYEDVFDRSSFGRHVYHTISTVYECVIDKNINLIPNKTVGRVDICPALPDQFLFNLRKCIKCEF